MIVVSDCSAITSLIQVEKVCLLHDIFGNVLIPEAVHNELGRSHSNLPPFIEARKVLDRASVARFERTLDLGEAEAIVLAKEAKAELLLIDEKLGREVAIREGLNVTGLVGVLIEAKRRGLVSSIRELVTDLRTEQALGFQRQ